MAGTLLLSARKESRAILPAAGDRQQQEFPQLERKKGQADETTWPFG